MRIKPEIHHVDVKELATMEADCVVASCRLHRCQKAMLEHTKMTEGDCELARPFCACM